jgi:hypothetical protein
MDEIASALEVAQIDVIEFFAEVLLGLQYLKPNGLKPRDDRLNFKDEVLAHSIKKSQEFIFVGFSLFRALSIFERDKALLTGSNDLSAFLEDIGQCGISLRMAIKGRGEAQQLEAEQGSSRRKVQQVLPGVHRAQSRMV